MTCRDLTRFIAGFLEDELAADVRRRFEHHLSGCPNCVRYLEQYRITIAVGRAAFADENAPADEIVPPAFIRAILERVAPGRT